MWSIPEAWTPGEGPRQTSEMASQLPADSLGEAEEVQGSWGWGGEGGEGARASLSLPQGPSWRLPRALGSSHMVSWPGGPLGRREGPGELLDPMGGVGGGWGESHPSPTWVWGPSRLGRGVCRDLRASGFESAAQEGPEGPVRLPAGPHSPGLSLLCWGEGPSGQPRWPTWWPGPAGGGNMGC